MLSGLSESCNLCFSTDWTPVFTKHGYHLFKCRGCGLIFVHPFPEEETIKGLYSRAYFQGDEYSLGASRYRYLDYLGERDVLERNATEALQDIEHYVSPGRVLDVGCAAGFFLNVARGRGWEVFGIELSEYACQYARHSFGLEVFCGTLERIALPPRSFDAITMWDVLEHVRDPRETVQKAHALLRPGGILALTTGDIQSPIATVMRKYWRLLNPPSHLYYFSGSTIRQYLENAGFSRVLSLRRKGKWVKLGSAFLYLAALLMRGRTPAALARVSKRVKLPLIHLNMGDSLTVIAKQ